MNKGINGKATQEQLGLEEMRQEVLKQELSTRSYVALRDKMQALIDISNMQEQYDKVMIENAKKLEKQQELYKKAMEDAMLEQGLKQEIQA